MANKPAKQTNKRFHISASEREYLSNNLMLELKAGLGVGDALEAIKDSTKSKRLRDALSQIQRQVDDGSPLWKALEASGILPTSTVALARVGEQSGNLVENLQIAAVQEAKQRTLKANIRAAMLYPSFVIGLTILIGIGVAWFLLPRLSETFTQLNVELPLISKFMLGIGTFLKSNGWWAVPASLAFFMFVLCVFSVVPAAKRLGQRVALHIPGVSRLIHEAELARFGHLAGSLLGAGLSITETFRLLAEATPSPAYRNLYVFLGQQLEQGLSFKESFKNNPHTEQLIPLPVQQIIIAAERSGSLVTSFESMASTYEDRAAITTRNLEAIIEPILLVVVWVGVMGVAVAVILPIYSLVGGLEGQ